MVSKRSSIAALKRYSSDVILILCILACWTIAIILVDPRGNFPIADDWAYLFSLKNLSHTGRLSYSNWTAANLVTQLLWTLPLTRFLDTDYETARLSTLIAGAMVGPVLYATMRTSAVRRSIAFIFSLSFVFNPIFFFLSFTYMTDIYYVLFQSISSAMIILYFRRPKVFYLVIGWLLGLTALLSRQIATAIPIAFACSALATRRWTISLISICISFPVSFVVVQNSFKYYLTTNNSLPLLFGRQSDSIISNIFGPFIELMKLIFLYFEIVFFYMGLMLTPVTVVSLFTVPVSANYFKKYVVMISVITSLLFFVELVARHHQLMPFFHDTLTPWGLGEDLQPAHRSWWYQLTITLAATFGGGILVACAGFLGRDIFSKVLHRISSSSMDADCGSIFYLLFLSIVLISPLFVVSIRFDRYFLPIVSSCIVLIAIGFRLRDHNIAPPKIAYGFACACVATFALASIVFMHDYLLGRRVEWQAMDNLISEGVKPEFIDAGWVFNGSYSYGKFGDPRWIEGWYERRDYVISFSQEPGYIVEKQLPARGWAPWARDWKVLVLKASR